MSERREEYRSKPANGNEGDYTYQSQDEEGWPYVDGEWRGASTVNGGGVIKQAQDMLDRGQKSKKVKPPSDEEIGDYLFGLQGTD